jgi:uncharacterized repeat protein (TIGR01451 family)
MLLQYDGATAKLQVDIDRVMNQVRIVSDGAIDGGLWIYFPDGNGATQVSVNGQTSTSVRLGDFITLNVPVADLALTLTDSPDPVTVGGDITYVLTVTNLGPATANFVGLTDNLGAGTSLVSVNPSALCSGTGVLTCNLGSLAAGAQTTVTVVAKANTIGALLNNASVSAAELDSSTANNSASATTTAQAPVSCLGTSANHRYVITGRVTRRIGRSTVGVGGVTMNLTGPNSCIASAVTTSDGSYSLGKITSGSYTLTPSKTGCTSFSPGSAALSITRNRSQNFTGVCQ